MDQQQKRSRGINLKRMRKHFALKPVALGVSAVLLSACSDNKEPAIVYNTLDDCITANPEYTEQCRTAYEQALEESARTAPRYNSRQDCEYDFGAGQCQTYRDSSGNSFLVPLMAGYIIGDLLSSRKRHYSQPLYTSYSTYSPYRGRWLGADGYDYGDYRKRDLRVSKDAYKPKPTPVRTIKRGGFGSSVRAKSGWSSSSRSGGWGG